jgi:hypothetical protein
MKSSKSMTERIEEFRAEVNAFIDKEVAEQKKRFPGLPLATIRNSITSGLGCACSAGLKVAESVEKESA